MIFNHIKQLKAEGKKIGITFSTFDMLALGPRAFGPDADEGANDSGGLFYWDLK